MKRTMCLCFLLMLYIFGLVYVKAFQYEDDLNCLVICSENEFVEIKNQVENLQKLLDNLHALAETARANGYSEDSQLIKMLQEEYNVNYKEWNKKKTIADSARYSRAAQEYPVATIIWISLHDAGYSEEVAAGILGNMMVEVGGGTLNLNYTAYSSHKSYYGLCQWKIATYPEVQNADLQCQMNYLYQNIQYELNTYGFKYYKGFNYQSFTNMTDPAEAARAFAYCYERCHKASIEKRAICATNAYNYFKAISY